MASIPVSPEPPRALWPMLQGVGLALALFAVYMANGGEVFSGDTVPAKYLAVGLIRGDGFFLDRYREHMRAQWPYAGEPYYFREAGGHCVSTYPVGPALLALPFTLPQVLVLDRIEPGWERVGPGWFGTIAKRSAAAIASLTSVMLLVILRRLGLGWEAWLAVTAAAFGSTLWTTASQSLWQHGPAAFWLMALVLTLWPEQPAAWRFVLGGVVAALVVCSRPMDLPFAVAAALWVAYRHPRQLVWFLPPALVIAAALVGYNRAYLGAAGGLYSRFDEATFATPFSTGLAGTLITPNRGLFIFSPWTLVAAVYAPAAVRQLRAGSLLSWLIVAILAHTVIVSKFTIWWAGHSFGPRFWTDVIPLLAVVFGLALQALKSRSRLLVALCTLLVALSIVIQVIGAALYPSGWNVVPLSVDSHPERVWYWTDTELGRCVRMSRLYRVFFKAEAEPEPPAVTPPVVAVETPTLTRPAGTLDRVECNLIQGWAWDAGRPEATVTVELYDGETLLATVPADRYRKDLARAKIGDGNHGFVWPTPPQLRDGAEHMIRACVSGADVDLVRSPRALVCPADAPVASPPPASDQEPSPVIKSPP